MRAEAKSSKRRSESFAKGEVRSIAFSIDDVAAQTGLSRRTLYNEIAAGRLITVKVGARRLILIQHRDAWLESRVAQAG